MKEDFLNNLVDETNFAFTENGAITHKTTKSAVLDLFALGGACRNRPANECILYFKDALEEDESLAIKCLFYIRDILEGQGERRFFRICFNWLCREKPEAAKRNLDKIAEYGRWDDLIYATDGTELQNDAFDIIHSQLILDLESKTPSLLAKWLPSENCSSHTSKKMASKIRQYFHLTHKQYRMILSELRKRINIVERLMSEGRWDEIEFDKIPSRAGIIYRNAFARRDLIKEKYKSFAERKDTKVNAKALYPYDIAERAFRINYADTNTPERLMLQKYWDNLPDYYEGHEENGLAIVDTSGSMLGRPMDAAVALGAYIAERGHGPFANHFITFSHTPELVKFEGVDITDKFNRASNANWGMDTNLEAVFDLLLKTALSNDTKQEDLPDRLYILSDMEFNECIKGIDWLDDEKVVETLLEGIARKWKANGYELPQVIFWNLDARSSNIPAMGGRFAYVSGFSPTIMKAILSGKDGYDLMIEKLTSKRYEDVG